MTQAVICDGCGDTIEYGASMQIQSTDIAEGSIHIDLCSDCATPVREVPAFKKKKDQIAKEMKDREIQMAQIRLEEAQSTGGDKAK